MTDGKFVLFARKMIKNPLLARKQLQVEMVHPDMANVSKTQIKEKLAQMFRSSAECITIFGCKTKFGGARSTAFALIYDSFDLKKKFDSKCALKRDGLVAKPKHGRKQKKEIKGRQNRLRGTAKAGAVNAQKKKK